jgi:hypothetical protein
MDTRQVSDKQCGKQALGFSLTQTKTNRKNEENMGTHDCS